MIHINIKNKALIRKKDAAIIGLILIISILFLIIHGIRQSEMTGNTAVISVDSQIKEKINLNSHKDGEFSASDINGITFEVKDGQIRIKSSDCPDKICVKTGFISKEGEKIVCLPKKLVVEIKNE